MKKWQKALTLSVITEIVTISVFVASLRTGASRTVALILHAPAILLIRAQVPWLAALLIEAALLMLIWFLLLRLFAKPKDELAKVPFANDQGEWNQTKVKPIVPR